MYKVVYSVKPKQLNSLNCIKIIFPEFFVIRHINYLSGFCCAAYFFIKLAILKPIFKK